MLLNRDTRGWDSVAMVTATRVHHETPTLENPKMPDYRRYRVPGGTYFFTVNLLERYPNDLLVRHVDHLRSVVRAIRRRWPFHVDAWVILPDHLHCVWTPAARR